jgi:hypothetical protein
MSITSLKTGTTGLSAALDNNYMEPIATTVVGSGGVNTVIFNNIPQTYKHLQLRLIARGATTLARTAIQFNSDTSSIYDNHGVYGTGSATGSYADLGQTLIEVGNTPTSSDTANAFAATVVDILDYTNINKYKVIRSLDGWDGNGSGYVDLRSGSWRSTSAISTLTILCGLVGSGNLAQYSRFSLYGIKG